MQGPAINLQNLNPADLTPELYGRIKRQVLREAKLDRQRCFAAVLRSLAFWRTQPSECASARYTAVALAARARNAAPYPVRASSTALIEMRDQGAVRARKAS